MLLKESLSQANMLSDTDICPLCGSSLAEAFHVDAVREYRQCQLCSLVFVPCRFWLGRDEEKAVYDLHENDPKDRGYRRFLSRLVLPMLERLDGPCDGLDFGCGPGPALSLMFHEHGHQVKLYDPFYCDEPSLLIRRYDFICATEVVEHLHNPDRELSRLFGILKPGGLLGIMTKLVIDSAAFGNWHYIRDLTHICFFSRDSFCWIADRYGVDVTFIGNDVILLQKIR